MPIFRLLSANSTLLNLFGLSGTGYVAVKGLEIKDTTTNRLDEASLGITWGVNDHPGGFYQNVRFNGVGLSRNPATGANTAGTNSQNALHISKCSQWRSWGIYTESQDGVRITDFITVHNGWDLTAVREDPVKQGGATVFAHAFYLNAYCTNMWLNRIVCVDATDGLGTRCGAVYSNQLVSIDNPVGITSGGKSSDVVAERPDGAPWYCDDVVIMGSDDLIAPGNPGGWALEYLNNISGSYMRNVAVFDFPQRGDASYNRYFAGGRISASQVPTYMLADKWSAWNYAVSPGETHLGNDLSNLHCSVSNSTLEFTVAGLNGTISGLLTRASAPVGYKTRSQVYAALGYASKSALVNAMLWRPDLPWAQAICAIALPAMGLSPKFQTAVAPSVVTDAPEVYKLGTADLTASNLNFTRGIPGICVLSGIVPCSDLTCSDLPSGFSMSAFRKSVTGTVTSGSNTITGVSDTTGMEKGMYVEAASGAYAAGLFLANTIITGLTSNTITCSANATGSTGVPAEGLFISAGGRTIRYDGSGTGAAAPSIHILETPKDTGMASHTTTLALAISAGASWTPMSPTIPARAYWDVSDISTLFQDTAGTVPVTTDGQTVKRINDKSGNGIPLFAQNNVGWVYHAGAKPYVTINGATENFKTANFVPVWADANGQVSAGAAINFSSTANAQNLIAGVNTYGNILAYHAGLVNCQTFYSSGGAVGENGPAVSSGVGVALTSIIKTTSLEAFLNGTGDGATTVSGTLVTGGDKIGIGGFSCAGSLSALAIFPTALGSTDHASFVAWLQARTS